MTLQEAKEFMTWLRANGVRQCSFNGLAVVFSPVAPRAADAFIVADTPKIQHDLTGIEELF